MREFLLYIKSGTEAVSSVQTYVTPSFAVDQSFWQERESCILHVIGKTSSLALAFSLREQINEYIRKRLAERQKLTDGVVAELRHLAVGKVREASVLYGREVTDRERDDNQVFWPSAFACMRQPPKDWFAWKVVEFRCEVHACQKDAESAGGYKIFSRHSLLRRTSLTADGASASVLGKLLDGRALLWEEIETLLCKRGVEVGDLAAVLHEGVLAGKVQWLPGVRMGVVSNWRRKRLVLFCERCGSEDRALQLIYCHSCEQGCAYCTICLGMGRSKCCTPYMLIASSASADIGREKGMGQPARLEWTGRYSQDQARAAERARRFVAGSHPGRSEFLIWAVCGAGKTELLFPSVAEALSSGGRVLIATPRKDVVLELAPRIRRVFPEARVIAVHGASAEKWEESDITIATTHQVMRYHRRFLLVVLDEADAFPYHNNLVLYRALARAAHETGKLLYLSATPPLYLQKRLVSNDRSKSASSAALPLASATHVLLPGRYHGKPLPVPEILTIKGLHKRVRTNRAVPQMTNAVKRSLDAERQVFVFVPRIDDVDVVLAYLQKAMPDRSEQMAGVHASDPLREEKVLAFRNSRYTLMVTTTILERGVTIPKSDVLVVGAEAPVFDEASLVQIAGRVGRSFDDTAGSVLFLQAERAAATKLAVRQISRMNQLAKKLAEAGGDNA